MSAVSHEPARDPWRYPRPAQLRQIGPRHNVIESSAGTGKTFMLEHLFVDLILSRGVAIDQILVVTYTDKATAELVLRLRALLARILSQPAVLPLLTRDESWTIDDAAKARLRQALLDFDRANISTIHGFCQRVLREHAFVQGRLWNQERVDAETTTRLAVRELWRAEAGEAGEVARALRAWQSSDRSIAQLEDLLCECAGHEPADLRPLFQEDRLVRALARWPQLEADAAELGARLKRDGLPGQRVKPCVERLVWLSAAVARCQGDALAFLAARFPRDGAVTETLAFLATRLPGPGSGRQPSAIGQAVDALAGSAVSLEAAVAHILQPRVHARARENKRRAGTFDFDDMLELVSRALADESWAGRALQDALRARYRYALIDEFQDTDATQWSIFRRIFVDSKGEHALTVIGDPKQAIYGFRGANVLAYLEARKTLLESGAAHLTLTQNFRSTPDLVDAQNLLFDQTASFFRPGSGISYDTEVSCGAPQRGLVAAAPASAAAIVIFKLDQGPTPGSSASLQAGLRAAVVDEMQRLFAATSPLQIAGRTDGRTGIRPRDVFVLTFTNDESRLVGATLGRAGIPFAFYKRGKLGDSPEAQEVLTVLRAVADPDDRNLVARAFLTRFFGLDMRQTATCLEASSPSEPGLRLQRWNALARKGDIPGLCAALLDDSGMIRREIFARAGERAMTDTWHVLELLQGEWARRRNSFPELVRQLGASLRRGRQPGAAEDDLQRRETEGDAVQILTVHKAKGLEADIVFVCGGTTEHRDRQTELLLERGVRVLHVGGMDSAAQQAADQAKSDENGRLVYVALTRARYRLYLPLYPAALDRHGPYQQANRRLGELLGPHLDQPHPIFEVREVACPASAVEAPPAQEMEAAQAAPSSPWEGPLDPPRASSVRPSPPDLTRMLALPQEPGELAAIRERRAGFWVTSYSGLKRARAAGGVPAGMDAEVASTPGQRAPDELPGGAQAGIFLHEILATVSLPELAQRPGWEEWFAVPGVAPLVERLARQHGRPPGEVAPSARLVHRAYTAPLRLGELALNGLALATRSLRELEFLFPIPEKTHPLLSARAPLIAQPAPESAITAEGWPILRGVVKGFIDLLFEHAGRIYVCDWKSDSLPEYTPDALARHCQQSYDLQARLYTLASLRFAGIANATDYGTRFGGVVFCFLRGLTGHDDGLGCHFTRPSWAVVSGWEAEMLEAGFWGRGS